jgi:oligosaccharide translocation protein RFT1
MVFQPIEETSRVFFSKALVSAKDESEQSKNTHKIAATLLMTLLLVFTHLLLLLATFAPPYLPLATSIFLPKRYLSTSAPQILGAYIYYIPIMAFNGVLEAFFSSACSPVDLRNQSTMFTATTIGFIIAAVGFARGLDMGDVGLIWANIANLGVRALYAWAFVERYFTARGLRKAVSPILAIPPISVLSVFAAAASVTRWSAHKHANVTLSLMAQKRHIGVGVVCGVTCLAAWCVLFNHPLALTERLSQLHSRARAICRDDTLASSTMTAFKPC